MTLAIAAACVLALLVIENIVSRRSARHHRELARMMMQPDPSRTRDELAYDAEHELTTRLLAAQLTQDDYRDSMAALAVTDQRAIGLNHCGQSCSAATPAPSSLGSARRCPPCRRP